MSQRVRTSLRKMQDSGVLICLSSGRSWESMRRIYNEIGLTGPAICYNGAMIVSDPEGTVIFERKLDEDAARFIVCKTRDLGLSLVAYRHSQLLLECETKELLLYKDRVQLEGSIVNFNDYDSLEFTKCIAIDNPENLQFLKDVLSEKVELGQISITYSNPCFLEMMGRDVDKSLAVRELCEIEEVASDETTSIGDGWNDLEMLEATGNAWVMGNAPEELRQRFPADQIAPEADEDGVAVVLESMF